MAGPQRRRRTAASTHDLLKEARQVAHDRHQLPCPTEEPRSLPMLPVSVSIDLPKLDTELREYLLYKLGDPQWEPKPAATRMAWTLGLTEKEEKGIEEDFAKATAPFRRVGQVAEKGLPPITNDTRVLLPVYVKRGHQVLRDELDIHIGSLGGLGNSMAAAVQSYATQVCRDLGLNTTWFNALLRHMGTLFSEVNEDIKATGTSELLVTPTCDGQLRPKAQDLPRLEEISPELEASERERARRRDEKLLARHKQKQEAVARAQAEAASTSTRSQANVEIKTEIKTEPYHPIKAEPDLQGQQRVDVQDGHPPHSTGALGGHESHKSAFTGPGMTMSSRGSHPTMQMSSQPAHGAGTGQPQHSSHTQHM